MLDAVLARFIEACPVAVLAQFALRRALRAEWVDAVFAAHAEPQYTRELLFSTVIDLMALVAVGLRPSGNAAAREALAKGTLGVSLQALHAKVNHSESAVLRALVREGATRLAPVAPAGRERNRVAAALRAVYRAPTVEAADAALDTFAQSANGQRYPAIAPIWRRASAYVTPAFAYPPEVRRIVTTTNAIESMAMQLRKVLKTRGHFPSDEGAVKLLYLALRNVKAR